MTQRRGRTVAILQARMSSRRLPGKVLMPLLGDAMILREIERLLRCRRLDDLVVATSTDSSDDELALLIEGSDIECFRGPLDDVFQRYVVASEESCADVVVRITGDCPLVSPEVVDLVVDAFHESSFDYCSNTLIPTYPDGLDVEVFSTRVLHDVAAITTDNAEREHVTLGIYRRPNEYSVHNVIDPQGRDFSHLRWTVDNAEDFAFVSAVYEELYPEKHDFTYEDILELVSQNPALNRTERDAARNAALIGLDTGAMRAPGNPGVR